ncbi:MAG: ABC transporter permease [Ruminococcus sp.]|nr:ABC transporter permease [Ruminococcus sp.]
MKCPLRKRLPRELKSDFGKYAVIFILMTLTIGFSSGFLVAAESISASFDEGYEKYNIENGNFETYTELTDEQISEIEENAITVYNNNYVETQTDNNKTIRIFAIREEVNKVCLMEGKMPDKLDEIALDRAFSNNNDISVGDSIVISGEEKRVTGFIALSDYSSLFSDNSETMFDATAFSVAVVTKAELESFGEDNYHYSYSWLYDNEPEDEAAEKEVSDELLTKINSISPLVSFTPRYLNQAINYARDDTSGDATIMAVLLYIMIAIMAFVFAVTISNTITKEAGTIGTLRASGYTKVELIRHYLAMPIIVTLISAVVGNISGYTIFRVMCAAMYYNSYSLTTYVTHWSASAFLKTTVVPIAIMLVITLGVLARKLSLSPLSFLRHELKRHQRKKAFKLNTKIPIFTRFRIRIIFQNIANYITLLVGIIFANVLLVFGLGLPDVLDNYQDDITSNMIAEYQYILKAPVETEVEGAEKFSLQSLENTLEGFENDEVSVYGIDADSEYIDADFSADGIYISDGLAEKYSYKKGDSITLSDKYSKDSYEFKIAGIYKYPSSFAVFMDNDRYISTFDLEDGYYSGYFSNESLDDIDESLIATVIDKQELTKISRQLDVSMGDLMYMVDAFAIIIFAVIIFLLSKIIVEKNASSISMTKILGYTNREINRLYTTATTIVVVICLIGTIPLSTYLMKLFFAYMMKTQMTGWFPLNLSATVYVKMAAIGLITYFIVSLLQRKKIARVPLGEALKNAE